MNIALAQTITGWMDDRELNWLAERAHLATTIIEVGSAYGRSTAALVDNLVVNQRVYSVDTWRGSPASLDIHHKDFREEKGDHAYLQLLKKLWPYVLCGKLITLRMDSGNASRLLLEKGVTADFIFIDADHDYDAVKADILNFLPLLKKDGVFAGHDYNHPHWPDVTKAVNEIFPTAQNPAGWIWTSQ